MSFDPWSAWRAAAPPWMPPGMAPGTPPPPSFAEFTRQFQQAAQAFVGGAGNAGATDAFTRYLREQFAHLRMPWGFDAAGLAAGQGPALGAGREHQERWQRLSAAAAKLAAAQQRLELLWSDALREASAAYAQQLGVQAPAAASTEWTPEALQGLYDRWIDCAEDAYGRMAHSEAYCDAFAEYVNAGSQWRNELQAGIEQWAKLLDLPTRSEINSLEQRLRQLEQASQAAAPSAPASASAPRRAKRRTPP